MKLRKIFFLTLLSIVSLQSFCQGNSKNQDRNYWLHRFLSVSYPLQSIRINSGYGSRKDPFTHKGSVHGGLDLRAHYENILAMFDGIVQAVSSDSKSGTYITLCHGSYTISYCHCSKIFAHVGDSVLAGDIVAVSGNTGRSTGPHLHITAKCKGSSINPYNLLLYIRRVRQEAYIALGGVIDAMLDPEEFIAKYAPAAMEQQQKYGIPASVTLSQMIYESAWGASELARKGNNYFGIKCSPEWIKEGYPYSCHNDEKRNEKFCNYSSVEKSIEHHSLLLMGDRYRKCRNYPSTDYHHWLMELKSAGYATSKDYVSSCEKIIKQYQLDKYDKIKKM